MSGVISALPGLTLLASTPLAGFTLVNGTPTMLTWTVPNDGNLHEIWLDAFIKVTSAQTGGAVTLNTELPDGSGPSSPAVFAGGLAANQSQWFPRFVQPGSSVTLVQSSAQTLGGAVVWARLWGM